MIFTKRSDYGLRAAMELAARYGSGPLSARQIARGASLPEPFVRKLLQELAQAGLATSYRGRYGGYELAKAPAAVTVRETLEAYDTLAPVPCLRPTPHAVPTDEAETTSPAGAHGADGTPADETCTLEIAEFNCPTRAAWNLVDRKVRETLERMTLDDLLREVRSHGLAGEMIHAS
jgi:Rrf2 family protein